MARIWIALGALNGFLAVLAGALIQHALRGEWAPGVREAMDIANTFHLMHALAIVAVGTIMLSAGRRLMLTLAGAAFLAGIVLFCGGIYAGFGPEGEAVRRVTPVGGLLLMAGWLLLAAATLTLGKREQ